MENIKEENKIEIGHQNPPPQKSDAPINDDATTGAGDSPGGDTSGMPADVTQNPSNVRNPEPRPAEESAPGGDINDGEENFVAGKQPVTQEKGDVTAFSDGYGGDSSKLEEEMENEMKNRQD